MKICENVCPILNLFLVSTYVPLCIFGLHCEKDTQALLYYLFAENIKDR